MRPIVPSSGSRIFAGRCSGGLAVSSLAVLPTLLERQHTLQLRALVFWSGDVDSVWPWAICDYAGHYFEYVVL